MIRTTERPNRYRAYPLDSTSRETPTRYTEATLYVSQGSAKYAPLGTTVYPFRELFVRPSADVTAIRYKQDSGAWQTVSVGTYPDLVHATRAVTFAPTDFSTGVVFTIEVTATDIVVTRTVKVISDVYAGMDKIAQRNITLHPFYDARFATNDDNLTAVEYKIDAGSKTAIPATYGADLADRVKAFKLSFDSAGTKRITLYVTDNAGTPQEFTDTLVVRVS